MTTPKLTTVLFLAGTLTAVHAQGPLAPPPGAPAPGMKTLTQIEPRTDLATVPGGAGYMHIINQSGSYYLSGNLNVTTSDGILMAASGVTLDLNGFSIFRSSGSAATGAAINLASSGLANIWIKNGHITSGVTYNSGADGDQFTGSGFLYGIRENSFPDPENVRVSHLHVSGCDLNGIDLGFGVSNTVEHCSVRVAGSIGIRAGEIHHSTAIVCGADAIQSAGNVSHSRGESVGTSGHGIFASGNVSNSYGLTTSISAIFHGIRADGNISNSYGVSSAGQGIDAIQNVSDSYGLSSGGLGIRAFYGNISNSYGISSENSGIRANNGNVSNSYGLTTGTGTGVHGIEAGSNVSNSRGQSSGGDGIRASGRTISYSRGVTSGTGVGLRCLIAIGCTSSGGEALTHKYNMP